jgi:translation initiation factor 2 alpha subunit (eIF-2alpha)
MKKDAIALTWLTKLEDVERNPSAEAYRELFEKLLNEFEDLYQSQESRHKQEIKRLEDRIEKLKQASQEELDNFIMEACVHAYNMPIK